MLSPSPITRRCLAFSGILSGIALALLALPRLAASALASQERRRYHLDYDRLQADLQRVRSGLQDYLAPARAQPRDVQPLSASYRAEDTSGWDDMTVPGRAFGSTAKTVPQRVGSKP
jgi:RAQPRD family integrative conjugative element protein